MKSAVLQSKAILIFLFSFNCLFGQDVSLQIQVGGNEQVNQGIGGCFLATGYQITNNIPSELNFENNQVSVSQFGAVLVQFTISVPLTTSPGTYSGNVIYEIYQTGNSLCFIDTIEIEVEVIPALVPEPDFSASPQAIIEGGLVQFTNFTENTVTDWLWDFGDGDTSTLENPSHSYISPGTYTVSLTTTGPAGSATETKTDFIQVFELGTPGQSIWAFDTGDAILSSPAIGADGTIYIGSNNGSLYALNPDGTEKWVFEIGYNNTRTPVIGSKGIIYILNSITNRIYAINPDGTEKWIYQATPDNGSINDRFALGLDETIYYGTQKGWLHAIDSLSNELWSVQLGTVYPGVNSLSIGTDGTLYVTAEQSNSFTKLYAINQDGSTKWETGNIVGLNRFNKISLSESGRIYVTGDRIFAFNREGDFLWRFPSQDNQAFSLSAEVVIDKNGNIYSGGVKGGNTSKLYSLDANGQLNWDIDVSSYIPTSGASNQISTPVIGNDGNLYFYVKGGVVFAVTNSGDLIWNLPVVSAGFQPNNVIFNEAPAMGGDGTFYFGYDDGNVHAISTGSTGMLLGKWSKQGQNNFNTRSYQCPFPYLKSPLDSTQNLTISPTFEWSPVFSSSEYEIQLSMSEDFSALSISQITSELQSQFIGIDYGAYYWRVRPILENGEIGCWSDTWYFTTEIMTGFEELISKYGLKLYPNPTKDFVFIEFNSPINSEAQLVIYNSTGNMVIISDKNVIRGKNLIEVDLQGLPSGTYHYQLIGAELKLFGRFASIK